MLMLESVVLQALRVHDATKNLSDKRNDVSSARVQQVRPQYRSLLALNLKKRMTQAPLYIFYSPFIPGNVSKYSVH